MKALYLDASTLVSAFIAEAPTPTVQRWLAARSEAWVVSRWTAVESASAPSFKIRAQQLDAHGFASAHAQFATFMHSVEIVDVRPADYETAVEFLQRL